MLYKRDMGNIPMCYLGNTLYGMLTVLSHLSNQISQFGVLSSAVKFIWDAAKGELCSGKYLLLILDHTLLNLPKLCSGGSFFFTQKVPGSPRLALSMWSIVDNITQTTAHGLVGRSYHTHYIIISTCSKHSVLATHGWGKAWPGLAMPTYISFPTLHHL